MNENRYASNQEHTFNFSDVARVTVALGRIFLTWDPQYNTIKTFGRPKFKANTVRIGQRLL